MFKHARITCTTHNEAVWDTDSLYRVMEENWDQIKGIDGKVCRFLIEETGELYPNLLTVKELKRLLSEEK